MRNVRRVATLLLFLSATSGVPAAAQTGAPLTIPLREAGGRLAVELGGPADESYSFAVSTANPVTVLTESTARRLAGVSDLDMSGVAVSLDGAHTVSDDALTAEGVSYDGMVGAVTLSDYDILVDLASGRLLLQSPSTSVAWDGVVLSDPVSMRVFHGVVFSLDVEVDGRSIPATLDLGTPVIVVNEGLGLGDLGTKGAITVALGATSLPAVPFLVDDNAILDRWDPEGRGFAIVGAAIARDCAISISWVHAELRTCMR